MYSQQECVTILLDTAGRFFCVFYCTLFIAVITRGSGGEDVSRSAGSYIACTGNLLVSTVSLCQGRQERDREEEDAPALIKHPARRVFRA